ncbi:DUF6336 family protein [Streptomyces albicerus]|uniref:DUF6336 family protein n=1 Tax=Streptomyces albicerus TaxID=2569859 RepID=UPI00124B3632|nr:DUF6336 family protein [Streptomyces albicerus]
MVRGRTAAVCRPRRPHGWGSCLTPWTREGSRSRARRRATRSRAVAPPVHVRCGAPALVLSLAAFGLLALVDNAAYGSWLRSR